MSKTPSTSHLQTVPILPNHSLSSLSPPQWIEHQDQAIQELLEKGLEWLQRLTPYDLAVVFELQNDRLVAKAQRGLFASKVDSHHTLDLDRFPSIRRTLLEQRPRVFLEHDHSHGDGDPFDGLLDFPPGHACMVVPLMMGQKVFGILTVDRSECVAYSPETVDMVDTFSRWLALTLELIQQRQNLAYTTQKQEEHLHLLDKQSKEAHQGELLENSQHPEVKILSEQARLVSQTPATVLIIGETGTGKEYLARHIHQLSDRRDKPFVAVNCAAIPPSLFESELFGHVKGAFTGAVSPRLGIMRAADEGTLFLDEIGEFPIELQAKLLRVLQERELFPVGAERAVKIDIRIIAATHVQLEKAVKDGRFREDLYYRLSVFPMRLVPLRDRKEDIPFITNILLRDIAKRLKRSSIKIQLDALHFLQEQLFPGNLRELSNILERGAIRANHNIIRQTDLMPTHTSTSTYVTSPSSTQELMSLPIHGQSPLNQTIQPDIIPLIDAEKRYLTWVLEQTQGRIYGPQGAAFLLQVPPTTLQSKLKKLGVVIQRKNKEK